MKTISRPSAQSTVNPPPPGPHLARVVVVAELGTRQSTWGTKEEIGLGLEVFLAGEQPPTTIIVPDVMNSSLHEKSKLGQYITAILGHLPYDVQPSALLGGEVSVTLGGTPNRANGFFPRITLVTSVPPGSHVPTTQHAPLLFDYGAPDPSVFSNLPRLFQKIIQDAWSQASKVPLGHGPTGGSFPPSAVAPAASNPFPHVAPPPGGPIKPPVAATMPVVPANPFAPPAGGVVPAGETAKAPVENPFEGDSGSEAWWNDLAEAVHARRNNPFN